MRSRPWRLSWGAHSSTESLRRSFGSCTGLRRRSGNRSCPWHQEGWHDYAYRTDPDSRCSRAPIATGPCDGGARPPVRSPFAILAVLVIAGIVLAIYAPSFVAMWTWGANKSVFTGGQGAVGYSSIYGTFKGL